MNYTFFVIEVFYQKIVYYIVKREALFAPCFIETTYR